MLTMEIKRQFLDLVGSLSPENLSCDGELNSRQIASKRRMIMTQWNSLEVKAGRSVKEDEVYGWSREVGNDEKLKRDAKLLLMPSHPLLRAANPGVWTRDSGDQYGSSAFTVHNGSFKDVIEMNGMKFGGGDNVFRVTSQIKYSIYRKEQIGEYLTLDEAVKAGEDFLKSVTRESIQAALPEYRPENIDRILARLPK